MIEKKFIKILFFISFLLLIGCSASADNINNLKIEPNKIYKNPDIYAIQGIDSYEVGGEKYVAIANGYRKSIVILNDYQIIKEFIIPNITGEDERPELIADVKYYNGNLYATSWRNGIVYKVHLNQNKYKEILKYQRNFIGVEIFEDHLLIAQDKNHEILYTDLDGQIKWKKNFFYNGNILTHPYGITVCNDKAYISFNRGFLISINRRGDVIKSYFTQFSEHGEKITNLQGIECDKSGNIFALDTSNKRIIIFNGKLNPLYTLSFDGFISPRGISIDKQNSKIYVSDFYDKNDISEKKTAIFEFNYN